jgi:hypothetical protein
MAPSRDELLAGCLGDYEERSSDGTRPDLHEYRERLGEAWGDFVAIVETETQLRDLIEPPPPMPLGGLFGPYELLRQVGRGSSGIVYAARHTVLNRVEAVKVLQPGLETDAASLERFRREVALAAEIDHPNIVRVHGAGVIEGHPYLAMELVEGTPLRALIAAGNVPSEHVLARGLAGVADGLAVLHGLGIIHRDVKPANIVLRPDGSMVLTDFGLAREQGVAHLTQTGQMLGTPYYMSPEQVIGTRAGIDGRSDVYGLGATAYHALAGRTVFRASSVPLLARRVLEEDPLPLARRAPHVDPRLAQVVTKAIERRPEDRYLTAEALRDDLRAVVDRAPLRGRPVSVRRRLLRRIQRHGRTLALTGALLVALTVALLASGGEGATRQLVVLPATEVVLDGEPRGRGPLVLVPGTYRIQATLAGFRPLDRRVRIAAEERGPETLVLIVEDPHDATAARLLRESLGAFAVIYGGDDPRGPGAPPVDPVLPRGLVRMEDLDRFRVEVNEELSLPEPAEVVFRRGGEALARLSWGTKAWLEGPIPTPVVSALQIGDVVTWGVEGQHGEAFTQSFTVAEVPDDARRAWERTRRLASGQHTGIRAWLRGSFLVDQGFNLAALREMRAAGAAGDCLLPWLVAVEAIARMDLGGSRPGREVAAAYRRFPAEVRAAWRRGVR